MFLILLTHSTKIYLTDILWVQCIQISLHNDDKWDGVLYKQTSTVCTPKRIRLFALIINCTIIMMKIHSWFSRNVYAISDRTWCNKNLYLSGTQPRQNMTTMGKVDTSDLIMIITWAIDISFQSHILKMVSWTHTTPYIVMKKKMSCWRDCFGRYFVVGPAPFCSSPSTCSCILVFWEGV